VNARTETEVFAGVGAGRVEGTGMFEDCRIAVGPAYEQKQRVACPDRISLNVSVRVCALTTGIIVM
jgi:hypothetical protein